MKITVRVNNENITWDAAPSDTLLTVLRREGFFGAKYGGCRKGECGACAILLDGKTVNSCSMLAAQADGHAITTVESLGKHPEQGWKESVGLHPLQKAFVETGAIQCGYCTPAQLLAAKSLLDKNPHPSEAQVREAISGVLCRCTGYLKPVQAVLRAAAVMRGEDVVNLQEGPMPLPEDWPLGKADGEDDGDLLPGGGAGTKTRVLPKIWTTAETAAWSHVGKPEIKVDAVKLALGKTAFTDDFEIRGLLYAKVLRSPHAHALIKRIDASKARALPGVAAVLTHHDIPRVMHSSAGQSDPIPSPLDAASLDTKVRFVGDRVAFVAAESLEIAERALDLIEVEYEVLPALLDMQESMKEGAPVIHDQPDYVPFGHSDPQHNVAAKLRIDVGDVEQGFKEADRMFECVYDVPKVQQAHIEPHICISYWDENDRMVIRTSTQVPFHVRRILAPILKLPIKRIRVIKPRIGGGFGDKQEMLLEDIVAHLTIATGRPVRLEYTREEEFIAARSRHPMRIWMKTGVKNDGTMTANSMYVISDTGAFSCQGMTVTGNTGHKTMALYAGDGPYRESPNIRFHADIVYTNHTPAGAYRGYGAPQGFFAVERHMDKIARSLGMDPVEFRLKNAVRGGELQPFSKVWSEGREPAPEYINSNGLEDCARQAKAVIGWDQKYGNAQWRQVPGKPHLRKGIGMAFAMHGTAIPYLDMGGASIKINEDGSFNLLVGATDLGTGSDTVLAQMAAEILGAPLEDLIVYSSDTDFTPFDKGAYASSTTSISGGAVCKAAEIVAERLRVRGARLINERTEGPKVEPNQIRLSDRKAIAPDGRFTTLRDIALHSMHHIDQEQIMGVASHVSKVSPPPFSALFAEITLDIETGQTVVDNIALAIDGGVIVNPLTASGQADGGIQHSLGYALCEEMRYDKNGSPIERDLVDYHTFRAHEMPEMTTLFVETFEPSHPFGIKAVGEIVMDTVAPAVANAILDASGAELDRNPATAERVWHALQKVK